MSNTPNSPPPSDLLRVGDVAAWIEQGTSIHLRARSAAGDPVELTLEEAVRVRDGLSILIERLRALDGLGVFLVALFAAGVFTACATPTAKVAISPPAASYSAGLSLETLSGMEAERFDPPRRMIEPRLTESFPISAVHLISTVEMSGLPHYLFVASTRRDAPSPAAYRECTTEALGGASKDTDAMMACLDDLGLDSSALTVCDDDEVWPSAVLFGVAETTESTGGLRLAKMQPVTPAVCDLRVKVLAMTPGDFDNDGLLELELSFGGAAPRRVDQAPTENKTSVYWTAYYDLTDGRIQWTHFEKLSEEQPLEGESWRLVAFQKARYQLQEMSGDAHPDIVLETAKFKGPCALNERGWPLPSDEQPTMTKKARRKLPESQRCRELEIEEETLVYDPAADTWPRGTTRPIFPGLR